jgi:aminoglycoside phosphotransferase (APT) family kinase protein
MAAALDVPEDPAARRALRCASAWLELGQVGRAAARGCTAVYGHGDANLANYLHNGGTVRLVDFEDSGRSDRAWELAIFTEHLSVHGRGQVPAELALGHFATGAAERARIREYRRLLVTFWLLKLLPVPRTGAIRPARSSTKRLACSNCWAEPSPPSHPNDSSAR